MIEKHTTYSHKDFPNFIFEERNGKLFIHQLKKSASKEFCPANYNLHASWDNIENAESFASGYFAALAEIKATATIHFSK